jgi:hypothetical protein
MARNYKQIKPNTMKQETQKELFDLLNLLFEIFDKDQRPLANEIGEILNKLQNELN